MKPPLAIDLDLDLAAGDCINNARDAFEEMIRLLGLFNALIKLGRLGL